MPYQLLILDWEGTLGDSFGQAMMPGARDFLEHAFAAGLMLAVATNKHDYSLQRDIQFFGLASFFRVTRSANQTQPKPDPCMLEEILAETQVDAKNAVMIGDSDNDMAMATAIKIDAIGIDFSGHRTASLMSAGAGVVFQNYETLTHYLFQGKEL